MPTLDIFNNDAFSVTSLTKAILETPFVPGRIGKLGIFSEEGISTTSMFLEYKGTTVSLVPAAQRGSSGDVVVGDKKRVIPISTIHLPQRGTILADEVQNIRAFGSVSEVETVQNLVNQRLAKMRRNLDATIEYQRIGALKGQVLDSDGSTVLLDLFTVLGVTQQTKAMLLGTSTTKMINKITEARRLLEAELGNLTYSGLRALCSPAFFDAFTTHPEVTKFYLNWQAAGQLTQDNRSGFQFGGVVWEEYRGKIGSIDFIADGDAYLVPEGVPDLFVTNFAPADYMETVNTIGLPYYAKQELKRFNKGVDLESQSNPISICTRPRTVIKLTIA